jgi:hypothetical protein
VFAVPTSPVPTPSKRNNGNIEEGGKVASGVVDAMKGTPMLLVVLLINAAFLASLVYLMGGGWRIAPERSKRNLI